MKKLFLCCLAIVLVAGSAWGQTNYYVNSATGNDSYDGLSPIFTGGSNGPKATIQAAINVAAANDIVNVAAGTYGGNVTVNKSLTLLASAGAILSGSGSGNGLLINAANVTVDGLEIKNYAIGIRSYGGPGNLGNLTLQNVNLHHNSQNGVLIVYDTFATLTLQNSQVKNNGQNGIGIANNAQLTSLNILATQVAANGHHGLYLSQANISSVLLQNSSFDGSTTNGFSGVAFTTTASTIGSFTMQGGSLSGNKGTGLSIVQVATTFTSILFDGVTVQNNGESGVMLGGGARTGSLTVQKCTLQGNAWEEFDLSGGWFGAFTVTGATAFYNNFFNRTGAAWLALYVGNLASFGSTPVLSNNSFSGYGFAVNNNAGATWDASGNWWGSSAAATVKARANNAVKVDYTPWLNSGTDTDAGVGFQGDFSSLWVDDDSPQTGALGRVHEGVGLVTAGGTVRVVAGTYIEQVTISRSLNLTGAGAATTIIKAPASLPPASNPASTVVDINGTGVQVDLGGFTISGPGPSGCGSISSGIFVRGGAYANVHDNHVLDIRDNPLSGCQNGVGIIVGRASFGTNGTADITNNVIAGYQKNGIVVSHTGSHANISGNTITGAGATTVIAQNGVQVSSAATAEINGNTVSGHSYTPFTWVATGMLLYDADANTDGNAVSENQVGIYHINGSGTHQNNQVSASAAGTGSPGFWGIVVDPGDRPRATPAPLADVPAGRATGRLAKSSGFTFLVHMNTLAGDGSSGSVGLEMDALGTETLDVTATTNTITLWEYGVYLYKDENATLNANIIECNKIFDNTAYGLYNSTGATANAVGNWWGDASGPSGTGPGSGDAVSSDVDYTPWGTDADCGGQLFHNYVLLANEYVEIARSKHSASTGDIHANGTIWFKRGDPTTFTGNLTATGKITIDKENKIVGDVTAGGKIALASGSQITGTKTANAPVATVPLPGLAFTAGGANHTVRKGGTLTLPPGSYGDVIVGDGATLKLSSGRYFFNRLETLDDENTLHFDVSGGGVEINVVISLLLREEVTTVVMPGGESASLLVTFNTLQTTRVLLGKESYVLGNVVAPNAEVYLAKNVSFRGGICAKRIIVDRDVVFLHHFAGGTLPFQKSSEPEDAADVVAEVVREYQLAQNYPNPFNPGTTITFALPEAGAVVLRIYNETGQLVRVLAQRELPGGWHELRWDGRNQAGEAVAAGVYLYQLQVSNQSGEGKFTATRRMVLVK